jgi:hypothetical protein
VQKIAALPLAMTWFCAYWWLSKCHSCRRDYFSTIFFSLDPPSPGSLPQFDTVMLLKLLQEPVTVYGMTIRACSLNEMYILFGNLISEQFSIRMTPILGIFAQTRLFIVLSQPALSAPGINPHFSTGSWEQVQEVARLSHQGAR